MNNSEILNLIKAKELEVRKLQLEVEELKKQLNEITTNSAMDTSNLSAIYIKKLSTKEDI